MRFNLKKYLIFLLITITIWYIFCLWNHLIFPVWFNFLIGMNCGIFAMRYANTIGEE